MWEEHRCIARNHDVFSSVGDQEPGGGVCKSSFPRCWASGRKEDTDLAWADGTCDHDLGLWSILKATGLGMENIP